MTFGYSLPNSGNSIETATIDSSSMKNIANGIAEASMMEEEELSEQVFDIEITGSGNWFRDVPFAILDAGNVSGLAPYRVRMLGEEHCPGKDCEHQFLK